MVEIDAHHIATLPLYKKCIVKTQQNLSSTLPYKEILNLLLVGLPACLSAYHKIISHNKGCHCAAIDPATILMMRFIITL